MLLLCLQKVTVLMIDKKDMSMSRSYQQKLIPFDDLIVKFGESMAKVQYTLTQEQVESRRELMRAVRDGLIDSIPSNSLQAHSLSNVELDLNVSLTAKNKGESSKPEISIMPINAKNSGTIVNTLDSSTSIHLNLKPVPQQADSVVYSSYELSEDYVYTLAEATQLVKKIRLLPGETISFVRFVETSRLWMVTYIRGRSIACIVIIDDQLAEVNTVISFDENTKPAESYEKMGAPKINAISPREGQAGDLITISGDNFLTLEGSATVLIDNQEVIPIETTLTKIVFKIPGWARLGQIEIRTTFGVERNEFWTFKPLPSIDSIEPVAGSFDIELYRGTILTFWGNNLQKGCSFYFTPGVPCENVTIVSPFCAKVEVPEDARTGIIKLQYEDYEWSLPLMFTLLPSIHKIVPRQAVVGEEVCIYGHAMDGVHKITIGNDIIRSKQFTYLSNDELRFIVPGNAYDGPIKLSITVDEKDYDVISRSVFYVIPKITRLKANVVQRGDILTLEGEGLDPDSAMMSILFATENGRVEAPVLYVSTKNKTFKVRVPDSAVTGFLLLIHKRIYSGKLEDDTSNTFADKLLIISSSGALSDVIHYECFNDSLSDWKVKEGKWEIDRLKPSVVLTEDNESDDDIYSEIQDTIYGTLKSKGNGQLSYTGTKLSQSTFIVYADVLRGSHFGFELLSPKEPLNIIFDIAKSTLQWQHQEDSSNEIRDIEGEVGDNYFVQLNVTKKNNTTLTVSIYLNLKFISEISWKTNKITGFNIASNSDVQRWDHIALFKNDCLLLPDLTAYLFNTVTLSFHRDDLIFDSFTPRYGKVNNSVVITGDGFSDATRVYIGEQEANVTKVYSSKKIRITIPSQARTAPIILKGRNKKTVSSGKNNFVILPKITSVAPLVVKSGDTLCIAGTNFPLSYYRVRILGVQARVVSETSNSLFVIVPMSAEGKGNVEIEMDISGEVYIAKSSISIKASRWNTIFDLIIRSNKASWKSNGSPIKFNSPFNFKTGAVYPVTKIKMEDNKIYSSAIIIAPPTQGLRSIVGSFAVNTTRYKINDLELWFSVGFAKLTTKRKLLSKASIVNKTEYLEKMNYLRKTDLRDNIQSCCFEVRYRVVRPRPMTITLIPKRVCYMDGKLDICKIKAKQLIEKQGYLDIIVYSSQSGLSQPLCVTDAKLLRS